MFPKIVRNDYIHDNDNDSEVEQSSYEDDLQILRVIEAYCFSKQRHTITNSGRTLSLFSRMIKKQDTR